MKYKTLKRILPAALAVSMLVPQSVLAAPKTAEAVEELEIEEEIVEGDAPVEEVETGAAEQPETEESEQQETEESEQPETPAEQVETQEESVSEVLYTEESEEEILPEQQLVTPPAAESTFRFMKIEKEYAISRKKDLSIYEKMDEDSIVVGNINKKGILYIISEEEDGWVYAESGKVRGFVKKEFLITGSSAERYIKNKGEDRLETAEELIGTMDNEALTYKKLTVYDTVERKKYAIALQNLEIFDGIPEKNEEEKEENGYIQLEDETESPSVVGTLEEGGVCYVLADSGEEWIYVESGDVRGFVNSDLLLRGHKAKVYIDEHGEEELEEAQELIPPEENKACYYTLTSVKEASVSGLIRSAMISFAEQFIGNPYVWGGTSLTNGADCSGFVQSIYSEFGYSLPRVAEDQAYVGMKIPVEDAAPGDLIFYRKNGEIYHVVMSLGNGKTIEAQSSATGIVYGSVNYNNAVWATRIISDEDTDILERLKSQGKADVYTEYTSAGYTYGKYLGNFKLTSYCACPICCGIWSDGTATTASGTTATEGRTVAMGGVPFGTKLVIGGLVYTVEDRGTPYGHVDIYKNNHQDALNFGVQHADVYLAE
jgi:3D (Asp-Asp-Asp) domain-containing protein